MIQKAVYAGSFDPPTWGHVDIVMRVSRIFDHVVVLVAENTTKQTLFTSQERLQMMKSVFTELKNVQVDVCSGLVADYCRSKGVQTLIRGLRTISDYEYEASMSRLNADLNPQVDTIFLLARKDYLHLKSDVVKEIARFGGELSKMVPPQVEQALRQKFPLQ